MKNIYGITFEELENYFIEKSQYLNKKRVCYLF